MKSFFHKKRADFPALSQKVHNHPLIYLDNGATTLKPLPVIKAIKDHYQNESANIHRGLHFLSTQATEKYELTRKTLQEFINAPYQEEIIFTKGTTESINLVASSWSEVFLNQGDEILISTMEHHSNIVPWQLVAKKKGAKIIEIPLTDEGDIHEDIFKELLKSKRVKMVALVHISNTLGTINDVKKYSAWAHEANAHILIDGAQSIAHTEIDIQDLGADFFAFSGHKMLGPTGVGVLWGRKDLLEKMPPYQGGGGMIKDVSFQETTFNDLPEKFEAGTPPIAEVIALREAIIYLKDLGLQNIFRRESELLHYATEKLLSIKGLRLIGQSRHKASILSFVINGLHTHDLGMILDEQGVAIRTGHHCTSPLMKRYGLCATARASLSFYNTEEDIEVLEKAIRKAQELL